jgi:hypothetical protein
MFWMTYQNSRDDMLPFYEDETSAIHRRDPEAARAVCLGRSYLMGQTMLSELFRRRVFTPTETVVPGLLSGPLRTATLADVSRDQPVIAF